MRRRLLLIAATWLSGVSVLGCATANQPLSQTSTHYVLHKAGMVVQLDVPLTPIVARRKTDLTVSLLPGNSSKSESKVTRVWIEESMTDMSMPQSPTIMDNSGSETYEGSTIFPMGGSWMIQVYIKSPRATFHVAFPVQVTQ